MGKRSQMKWCSTLSNCILKTSNNEYPTTSPGRLFQQITIFIVKKIYFLHWNETYPSATLSVSPLSSPVAPSEERASVLCIVTHCTLEYCDEVPPEAFLLQGEENWLPHPFLVALIWTICSLNRFFLNSGNQNWTQYS